MRSSYKFSIASPRWQSWLVVVGLYVTDLEGHRSKSWMLLGSFLLSFLPDLLPLSAVSSIMYPKSFLLAMKNPLKNLSPSCAALGEAGSTKRWIGYKKLIVGLSKVVSLSNSSCIYIEGISYGNMPHEEHFLETSYLLRPNLILYPELPSWRP